MLRIITVLFGIIFIFIGVAGFLPSFSHDGLLFGLFETNSMQDMIHLVSGVIAIMAATSYGLTVLFLRLFGLFYTVIAIWGFWKGGDLYIIHANTADNILHIVAGLLAFYLGLSPRSSRG